MDEQQLRLAAELFELGRAELPAEDAHLLAEQAESLPLREELNAIRDFDQSLGQAMRAVPVPGQLKQQVLDRMAEKRAIQIRKRIYEITALAAAVLLVGFIAWNWNRFFRPSLDAESIVARADFSNKERFARAEAWLAEQDLHFQPERAFEPDRLVEYVHAELLDRTVPMLLFVSDQGEVARVYIVRTGQFQLEDQDLDQEAHKSFASVRILTDRTEPHRIAYVVVFTGQTLEPFLRRPTPMT